nr:4-coumarate--CoA ligase-like 9 [Tanacetum cinerariifolium]
GFYTIILGAFRFLRTRDEEAGEVPVAFVTRRPRAEVYESIIINFVAEQVAPYKKVRSDIHERDTKQSKSHFKKQYALERNRFWILQSQKHKRMQPSCVTDAVNMDMLRMRRTRKVHLPGKIYDHLQIFSKRTLEWPTKDEKKEVKQQK